MEKSSKITIFSVIIILLLSLVFLSFAGSDVGQIDKNESKIQNNKTQQRGWLFERTATSDTYNNADGTYTTTLYSGIAYVQEDGNWKKPQEARSLKDKGFNIKYLDKDKNYKLNIIDFNYTSIEFELEIDDSKINKNIDYKVWKINKTKEKDDKIEKKSYKDYSDKKKDKKIKQKNKKAIYIEDFGFNTIIEIGGNSTTITLGKGNITEDGYIQEYSPNYVRYNSLTGLKVDDGDTGYHRIYIEWDISSIPTGVTISNTTFKYHGDVNNGAPYAHIHEMVGVQPSAENDDDAGNKAIYDEAGEGTVYADPDGFPVVGANQTVDLGTSADSDLQSQLSVGWFAIGIQGEGLSWHAINSVEDETADPAPTLIVEYITMNILSPQPNQIFNATYGQVDFNITTSDMSSCYWSENYNCYQETANVSTSCGGLDSGKYSFSGTWDATHNESATIDGDWSTFGKPVGGANIGYLYVNYTTPQPLKNINPVLQVKSSPQGNDDWINISCLKHTNNVYTQIYFSYGGFDIETTNLSIPYECQGENISLEFVLYSDTGDPALYEEAMIWDFYTEELDKHNATSFSKINSTMSDGSHTVKYFCNETDGTWRESATVTFTSDLNNPSIFITEPTLTNYTTTNISLNFSITETNPSICWWSNNSGANNFTITCGQNTSTTFPQGWNNYTVWANDTIGNLNSTYVNFYVDSLAPVTTASATSPPDVAEYTFNTWTKNNVKITLITTDSGIGYDNTAYPKYCTDTSNTCTPNIYISSGTTITTEGTSYIRYNSQDYLANTETTKSQIIKIDKTPPSSILSYPTDNLNFTSNTTINLNFSVSDTNSSVNTCWFTIDSGTTNTTIANCQNTTFNSPEGDITLNFYVNDSVNNINTTESATFTIDLTPPSIFITYPTSTNYTTNISSLNYSATDSGVGLSTCWYSLDSGATNSTPQTCGTNWTGLISNEGSNTWIIYSNDTENQVNQTSITFTKDTILPQIYFNTGTEPDYSNLSQSFIYANITLTETNFANITFILKNDTTTINTTTYSTITTNINWTNLEDNNYSYYVNTTDLSTNLNSTQIRHITLDTTNPNITLIKPQNATYNSTADQNFSANITDNLGIKNITLYIHNETGEYNQTTTFIGTAIKYTIEILVNLKDGIYNWWYKTFDWAGNFFTSQNRTITIDTINPDIYFNGGTENNYTNFTRTYIFTNISVSELNEKNITFYLYNQTSEINSTTYTTSIRNINWTNLPDDLYDYNITIYDLADNKNSTETRQIRLDNTIPTLIVTQPEQDATYSTNTSLNLNYSATDSGVGLSTCWYNIINITGQTEIANTTIANCLNTTFNVTTDTTYNLTLYVNDSLNNINSQIITFAVSRVGPAIVLDYPPDNQWFTSGTNIYFNFTATDGNGLDTCQLWGNWTGTFHLNYTWILPGSGDQNFTTVTLAEGNYLWSIRCNDTLNNYAWALNNRTIHIDETYPQIFIEADTLANDTNSTNTYIYINISASDINFVNITYNLYNQTSEVNSTTYTTLIKNITWFSLLDEIYTYNITIIDLANNINSTETRLIRLDDTIPSLSIVEPQAINYATNTTMYLNYSASDNLVGLDKCWYYVINSSSSVIVATTTLSSCQNTTFGLPEGDISYTLYLFAQDLLTNIKSTSVTFGIRTVAPNIVLYPVNDSFSKSLTNNYFNFTVTTNADSISVCELWGNFNSTYYKNQTITLISETSQNNFSALTLTEGSYIWNVWCNDSLNNYGFALNNVTFTTDITYPNITINLITTTRGSQTITFNSTTEDKNLDTCKFSIYDSGGNIDGLNENVSFPCNTNKQATVTAFATYNLTVYSEDKAGNENSTIDTFTTSPSAPPARPSGGGGGIKITPEAVAVNFSITTLNFQSKLDVLLAKDSVKPRTKQFYIINQGKDIIEVEVICDTQDVNQSSKEIDICDYVTFSQTEFSVSPVEEERSFGEFYIETPPNVSIGDIFYFNVLALRIVDSQTQYSKLSVTARVSALASLYKWSELPGQADKPEDERITYPVIFIALFISFILFAGIFLFFRSKDYALTGFIIGFVTFVASMILLIIFL